MSRQHTQSYHPQSWHKQSATQLRAKVNLQHINIKKKINHEPVPLVNNKVITVYAHLADDVPVRKTDNHPVLGCVVLVFILNDQALTSKEVSLALWMEHTLWLFRKNDSKQP